MLIELPQDLQSELVISNSPLVSEAYSTYKASGMAELPDALRVNSLDHYYLSVYPGLPEMVDLIEPPTYPGKISSVYVHTPFCSGICDFCSYLVKGVGESKSDIEAYYSLLDKEVLHHASQTDMKVSYIYFGGGTPSLVPPAVLGRFLSNLDRRQLLAQNPFGTVELHPEFFTDLRNAQNFVDVIKSFGIGRVSLGFESASDEVLTASNRRHTGDFLKGAIDFIKRNGLIFNLDLMYGLPNLSLRDWESTLQAAVESDPDSVTPYYLFVDKRTGLRKSVDSGEKSLPSSDLAQIQHIMAQIFLESRGYYELPNDFFGKLFGADPTTFTQEVLPSQSISLPIGAGGYGFYDNTQIYNDFNLKRYAQRIIEGRSPVWKGYKMDDTALMRRDIMFSLKNAPVINRQLFMQRYGTDPVIAFPELFAVLANLNVLTITDDNVRLTAKGRLMVEPIACQFKDPRISPTTHLADPDLVLVERHTFSPTYQKIEI